jgi:hypothetical protein
MYFNHCPQGSIGKLVLVALMAYLWLMKKIVNHYKFIIDLRQHSLSSESKLLNGVFQSCFGTTINLSNGVIKDVGTGVVFYQGLLVENSPLSSLGLASSSIEDDSISQTLDKRYYEYIVTNHIIEDMSINATNRGANIYGGKNIIRNSTIEVDGHTAIYMSGPNPVIENNTIIIHGKGEGEFYKKKDTWIQEYEGMNLKWRKVEGEKVKIISAPIKLRDAKGGIIRNNKIIYKGGFLGFGKAPVAINLLDSKDVLIENNTIEGFDKLVRENGDTSFTEKNNIFVR